MRETGGGSGRERGRESRRKENIAQCKGVKRRG